MALLTLKDLFIHELKDLCDAEKQLTEALPKMRDGAKSPKLRETFESHLKETESHLAMVKELLTGYGESARVKCKGMEGLLEEGSKILKENDSPVKDAALIAAAQRVEHYEMAGYGTARAYAEELGEEQAVEILTQILGEENTANDTLNRIAMSDVNRKAGRAA